MSIDPERAARLEALFIDQRECAESLARILDAERAALRDGNIPALEDLTSEKTEHLEKLDQLRKQELVVLQPRQNPTDADPGLDPLEEFDLPANLQAVRRAALDAISTCQTLNLRNGTLLQHRIGFVRRALDVLGNIEGSPRLYDSDGQIEAPSRLRLVARG